LRQARYCTASPGFAALQRASWRAWPRWLAARNRRLLTVSVLAACLDNARHVVILQASSTGTGQASSVSMVKGRIQQIAKRAYETLA
jgi:hypothetical protein